MSSIITELVPLNLLEEKQTFFSDPGGTYNPQFVYQRTFSTEELTSWGVPDPYLAELSQRMLARQDRPPLETDFISTSFIEEQVQQFNERYQLNIPIQVHFSTHQVTRCRVSGNHIYFQLPIRYTTAKFAGLFRHELETHVLRRLNHEQQPWGHRSEAEPLFRRTEEGLANLHSHLLRNDKVIRKTYLTYLAVATAQRGNFRDVFNIMTQQGVQPHTAWNIALRTKRGLADTAQPGGLTKDIVYMEGTIQVWQWILNAEHDPHDLYLGRIGLSEIATLKPQANISSLRYPYFLDNIDEYRQHIRAIGEANDFPTIIQHVDLKP